MKAFDKNYKLLEEMYQDGYFPDFLVDKVKAELQKVIDLLERGETDREAVQEKLDEAVCAINDLQEEFDEHDSEIETVARDCIGESVGYILAWFGIPIDVEEAIREHDKEWGYTSASKTDFLEEYGRIVGAIYDSELLGGFCYTQLTDVEQETNGLLTYDHEYKFDPEEIRKINDRKK